MNDPAATPPVIPPPKAVGGKRATLALVLSCAALGFSLSGPATRLLEGQSVIVPLMHDTALETPKTDALQQRVQTAEARQGQFAEDLATISTRLDELAKAPPAAAVAPTAPAEEIKGSVEDLRRKLGDVEKGSASLQTEIETALLRKSRLMADWGLLQSLRRRLQEGTDAVRERQQLKEGLADLENAGDAMPPLEAVSNPLPVSDRSLRADLQALAPQFAAQEKMQKADGFFPKLLMRVQNLVTIRPRDGLPRNETDSGKTLEALQHALDGHDWRTALKTSGDLAAKSPPGFAEWQARLQTRADAEGALDRLDDSVLSALRGHAVEMPAATPAVEEKPAAEPAPAHKKAVPAPEPEPEIIIRDEAAP